MVLGLLGFGAGLIVGLLVGRKNPSIAAATAKVAAAAQTKATAAVKGLETK